MKKILICAALLAPVSVSAQTWDATGLATGTIDITTITDVGAPNSTTTTTVENLNHAPVTLMIVEPSAQNGEQGWFRFNDLPQLVGFFGPGEADGSFSLGPSGPSFSFNGAGPCYCTFEVTANSNFFTANLQVGITPDGQGVTQTLVDATFSGGHMRWTEVGAAPEIDPAGAISALTLLAGLMAVIGGCRRLTLPAS